MKIEEARESDAAELAGLWQACGLTRTWNDPAKDLNFALSSPVSIVLVGREQDKIIASVMVGHDGHCGALYYVSVSPDHRGKGLGRAIHDAAIAWLRAQGVWKLNLLVRTENIEVRQFYESLGYQENKVASFSKVIA